MTWVSAGIGTATTVAGIGGQKRADRRQLALDQLGEGYENERMQKRSTGRLLVDQAIDSPQRQQQYASFANALRGFRQTQLDRQRGDTARNLKFSLARNGQVGGSLQRDTNQRFGEEFADAAIGNERAVGDAVAGLRANDETTRRNVYGLVDNGYSFTDAGRRASEGLRANLGTADARGRAGAIGDIFSDSSATYRKLNERAALRRGLGSQQARLDLYGG